MLNCICSAGALEISIMIISKRFVGCLNSRLNFYFASWPCLHQWLETRRSRQTCPVCKAGISKDKVIPIYGRGNPNPQDPRSGSMCVCVCVCACVCVCVCVSAHIHVDEYICVCTLEVEEND